MQAGLLLPQGKVFGDLRLQLDPLALRKFLPLCDGPAAQRDGGRSGDDAQRRHGGEYPEGQRVGAEQEGQHTGDDDDAGGENG